MPTTTKPTPDATLLKHLTALAAHLAPALAHLPKAERSTLGPNVWRALEETVFAVLSSIREPAEPAHRTSAASSFDLLKWYLHLLEGQKLVTPAWLGEIGPDLLAVGRLLSERK